MRKVSIRGWLKFFNTVITPVACFAAEHRVLYREDLRAFDVEFRRLLRKVVGPPPDVDWTAPWPEVLHCWHERVKHFQDTASLKSWSECCSRRYWTFLSYISTLPPQRWIRRLLAWQPEGTKRRGRPAFTWTYNADEYCRANRLPHWLNQDSTFFMAHLQSFVDYCCARIL